MTRRRSLHLCLPFMGIVLLLFFHCVALNGCSAQNAPRFDSAHAFSMLKKQCDFGPRPPGTPAHEDTKDFLADELSRYTDDVRIQSFQRVLGGKEVMLSNIIADFKGKSDAAAILLCAHWDTRPTADEEIDVADRKRPILGANDGASGVAVLLGLARMFKQQPPPVPVQIVLFDGEDYGPTSRDMFIGSRKFASLVEDKSRYRYGVLLDMVGDKDLQIYREGHSQKHAREVVDKIWTSARKLGYGAKFPDEVKYTIQDDHVPLIEAGIPCADVIDFDYAYWHTLEDTADKCSAESLGAVGSTIARVVYTELP